MPENNWGPFYLQTDFEYPIDGGQPTPPAPASQSPSGSVTGESAEFNFDNAITSTEEVLTNVLMVESPQQGTPALISVPVIAGVDPGAIQWNGSLGGVVGIPGNKFS